MVNLVLKMLDLIHNKKNNKTYDAFIINKNVYFDPHHRELRNQFGTTFLLSENCNQLLVSLINGITLKNELIDAIWTTKGVIVTDNSYHQLVKLLRRKLSEVGLPENTIVTIPRYGLGFNGDIKLMRKPKHHPVSAVR